MISGKKVSVVLQRRTRVPDGKGGSSDLWTELEFFRAVLSPAKLNIEGMKYNKEIIEGDHLLYSKAISNMPTNFDRITYKGRIFDIRAVQLPLMSNKLFKLVLLEVK